MVHLPEDFIRETRQIMGEERFIRFMKAFDEDAPTSIRINPRFSRKEKCSAADSALESNLIPHSTFHIPQKKVPWCAEGYYLSGRPQFTFDPLFHAGCYYVQEAASMFITHVLRTLFTLHSSLFTVLDLCAAPGGKSTAMRTVLPEGCLLVSNEPIPTRAQILLENITKWGWPDCIVTNNYPRDFRKSKMKFDLILCDVPCSGEGMFRKDPDSIGEWSLQNVEKCWRLQREIVADAWECLSPGGILIYSTCTFNKKENEENVRWILETYDAEALTIPTEPSWNITGSLLPGFDVPVYRFIPGITRSEGLFMCVLRKTSRKEEGGGRILLPQKVLPQMSGLNVISSPPKLGGARGGLNLRQTNPSFRPPLTPPDSGGETARIDLSYQDALKYLRGEALVLPADTPRGIVTVTYKGIPLGPVKNIGNRANNLYPKPWRIKTTHLPSEPVEILAL
jgi:16S rRNA C967 or C1407 C5-methylase (RsmB/RsmF family)